MEVAESDISKEETPDLNQAENANNEAMPLLWGLLRRAKQGQSL